jgi:hypothetical protein
MHVIAGCCKAVQQDAGTGPRRDEQARAYVPCLVPWAICLQPWAWRSKEEATADLLLSVPGTL